MEFLESTSEITSNIRSVCRKQLLSPPSYEVDRQPLVSKLKTLAAQMLGYCPARGKYDLFWTNAILALGVEWSHRIYNEDADLSVLQEFFDGRLSKQPISGLLHSLDGAMNGCGLIYLEQITGKESYRQAVDKIANYLIIKHARSRSNILPYQIRHPDLIYIDSTGMICPFLAWYGSCYNRQDALDLSVRQLTAFLTNGIDMRSGLPYHAYRDGSMEQLGACGWGRGIGWLLIGMIDTLDHMPSGYRDRDYIAHEFRQLIETVVPYQDGLGNLNSIITDKASHSDTSATAMLGYAVARGVLTGVLQEDWLTCAQKAFNAILDQTGRDGLVGGCSGECIGLGSYSEKFGPYPWAQGPAAALEAVLTGCNKK